MRTTTTLTASALLWLLLTPAVLAAVPVSEADWEPMEGDSLIVQTDTNMGYLLHKDSSSFLQFKVATGQRRVVHYIGLTYNASTPIDNWVAKEAKIKKDRITFGPTGLFLRLFRDGEGTNYGIHGEAYSKKMLSEDGDKRYFSMGCIIVSEDMMKIIKKTFDLNGNSLNLKTVEGPDTLATALVVRDHHQDQAKQIAQVNLE